MSRCSTTIVNVIIFVFCLYKCNAQECVNDDDITTVRSQEGMTYKKCCLVSYFIPGYSEHNQVLSDATNNNISKCKKTDCQIEDFRGIEGILQTNYKASFGGNLKFNCSPGYFANKTNSGTVPCRRKKNVPNCQKKCENPEQLPRIKSIECPDEIFSGSRCSFTCEDNTINVVNKDLVCLNGKFTPTEEPCKRYCSFNPPQHRSGVLYWSGCNPVAEGYPCSSVCVAGNHVFPVKNQDKIKFIAYPTCKKNLQLEKTQCENYCEDIPEAKNSVYNSEFSFLGAGQEAEFKCKNTFFQRKYPGDFFTRCYGGVVVNPASCVFRSLILIIVGFSLGFFVVILLFMILLCKYFRKSKKGKEKGKNKTKNKNEKKGRKKGKK